jgi:hypothetical protein
VGLGIWREVFVSLLYSKHTVNAGKLGMALGLGIVFGQILSPYSSVEPPIWLRNPNAAIWYLTWALLLLVMCYFFFKWVAATASPWLSVAIHSRSPYPFYTIGLILAGIVSGLLFRIMGIIQIFIQPLTPASVGDLLFSLFFTSFAIFSSIFDEPLTLISLILLWAFPLGVWFWRDRFPLAISKWVFLEQPSYPLQLDIQKQLQLRPALTSGLKGGLIYCILLISIALLQRLTFPEAVRQTVAFKLTTFYLIDFGLAIFIQAIIATKVARKIRELTVAHGLLAAFTSGCVMTVGDLIINFLFGDKINPLFVWIVFSHIINLGAILALLSMMVISLPKHLHNLFTRSNLQKA